MPCFFRLGLRWGILLATLGDTVEQNAPRRRKTADRKPTLRRGDHVFFDSMMVNVAAAGDDPDMERMLESELILCTLPLSVVVEAQHPNVPPEIRRGITRFFTTEQVPLNCEEIAGIERFAEKHRGSKKPDKMRADLRHVWEAAKYGVANGPRPLFVTRDGPLRKLAEAIYADKRVWVVSLEEAAALLDTLGDP